MKIKRGAILLALSIILSLLLSCRISFNNPSDENATQVKNAIQATLEVLQAQTGRLSFSRLRQQRYSQRQRRPGQALKPPCPRPPSTRLPAMPAG
jgi:hypothetical protein